MQSDILYAKQKNAKKVAYSAWLAALVTGCVWVFLDDAGLQPLYFFASLALALAGVNSWGMSHVYGELQQLRQPPG